MRMTHKSHGVTYVYNNGERDYLIKHGWEVDEEIPVLLKKEKTPTELYVEKFGKQPHHKMKDESILKALDKED